MIPSAELQRARDLPLRLFANRGIVRLNDASHLSQAESPTAV
jgi:hypothetical protein